MPREKTREEVTKNHEVPVSQKKNQPETDLIRGISDKKNSESVPGIQETEESRMLLTKRPKLNRRRQGEEQKTAHRDQEKSQRESARRHEEETEANTEEPTTYQRD